MAEIGLQGRGKEMFTVGQILLVCSLEREYLGRGLDLMRAHVLCLVGFKHCYQVLFHLEAITAVKDFKDCGIKSVRVLFTLGMAFRQPSLCL